MSLGQTIDAIVEQNHVQVDVAAVGMYEVVAADGQSVAIAADLPDGEIGVGNLAAGSNRRCTAVDGVHAIGGHIVRQTAGATDTTDDGSFVRRHAYLCHCLVEAGKEEVVTTSGAPTRLSLLIILCAIHLLLSVKS